MFKALCGLFLTYLMLSGCSVADIATARQLTIEDGAAFVRENHQERRDIREMRRGLVRFAFEMYNTSARQKVSEGDFNGMMEDLAKMDALLVAAYPQLATFELSKEAFEGFDQLRSIVRRIREVEELQTPDIETAPLGE